MNSGQEDFQLLRHIRSRLTPTQIRDYLLRHQPSQVYICIDMSKLRVTLEGAFQSNRLHITTFYSCPNLAYAVSRARYFCRRYYAGIPVLEYNIQ
jgi:hypothetical protein